jgi:hypothetical protein
MLTPDVNKQELEHLYKEAWDLFSVYFSPESPDKIHFSEQIVTEMHAGTSLLLFSWTHSKDILCLTRCLDPPLHCFSTNVPQHFEFKLLLS